MVSKRASFQRMTVVTFIPIQLKGVTIFSMGSTLMACHSSCKGLIFSILTIVRSFYAASRAQGNDIKGYFLGGITR